MTGIPELVKLSGEVAAYVELSSLRAELQLQMAVGLARAWSEKKSITLPEILDPSQHCHGHMWPTSLFRFNLYRTACRDNMKDDSNVSNQDYLKSAKKRHLNGNICKSTLLILKKYHYTDIFGVFRIQRLWIIFDDN